jgi:hypothetical protein
MQQQCNSSGGLCNRSANTVQPQGKSLNTARADPRFLLLADAEVLAAFCSVRAAPSPSRRAEIIEILIISAPMLRIAFVCLRLVSV